MHRFTPQEREVLRKAVENLVHWFELGIYRHFKIAGLDKAKRPSEWDAFETARQGLHAEVAGVVGSELLIRDPMLPMLKRAVIIWRREQAVRIQSLQDKTHHPEILGALDNQLDTLDTFVRQPWFEQTVPYKMPLLADVLPIQAIEENLAESMSSQLQTRKYDEKFHILQAPELFLPDVGYYRALTDLRGTRTTAAFLDIDHFSAFNEQPYNETVVDRNVLPVFMQEVEAHVHFHGHAYRQGGDEYLILLPGLSETLALHFLDDLRQRVSELTFPNVNRQLTISIGVCSADPDCHLTDRELQEKANRAKQYAKDGDKDGAPGRNRIATYRGNLFRDVDRYVVGPRAAV
jgi:diguanylate cyclase (GGDEF)-like protein